MTNKRAVNFIHSLSYADIPLETVAFARRCLLDLFGVAAAGNCTDLSRIIRQHSARHFAASAEVGAAQLWFDGRAVSPVGAALANGMMIDSVDAHDGHKLVKGHIGCGVLPAAAAMLQAQQVTDEQELITCLVIGYELGSRLGQALHRSACDYHTSGAWVALACAAIGARVLGLNEQKTREALGIAEYHGPRSQMMRAIDHPTMVKDGSGWGAMCGVSAAYLAQDGFTGAPALTVEQDQFADLWCSLGQHWTIHEQYFKPYPVCRWAQPPTEATLQVCREHNLSAADVQHIEVHTFHEAVRLATASPSNTEQAQYSLPYPVAAALVHGTLGPEQVANDALGDPEVQRIAQSIQLIECDEYNAEFPAKRIAHVIVQTTDGQRYESAATEARGDPEAPLSDQEIAYKFKHYTQPVLGAVRSTQVEAAVSKLGEGSGGLDDLWGLIVPPAQSD